MLRRKVNHMYARACSNSKFRIWPVTAELWVQTQVASCASFGEHITIYAQMQDGCNVK
jgi:hypothetical protein